VLLFFNGIPSDEEKKKSPSVCRSTPKFISAYISLLIFLLLYIWWKISQRTRLIKWDQMDFETGRSELNPLHGVVEEEKNVGSVGKSNKFLQWVKLVYSFSHNRSQNSHVSTCSVGKKGKEKWYIWMVDNWYC
jgi:hypothetical protein